jgi:aminoglycoside phosphotransferase (APT) family kinase protein
VTPDELAERLRVLLDAADVRGLARLSGGASRDTWRFVALDHDGAERLLVLQRQRTGGTQDMGREAAVLRAARRAGVPVPEVVAASSGQDDLGAAFVLLEHVPGETIARKILRDEAYATARRELPAQLGRAAAALHAVDPAAVPGLVGGDQVQQYRELIDTLGQPHPTFELAFRWLEANRPPVTRTAVVHGDFRLGNVIVGPEGLRAVLDWELAHLGDPVEDLGWLCVRAWRFGAARPVAGMGEYRDLLDAYAEASGVTVDPSVLRWWETLGTLKWGIMCIMQATVHLSGMSRSHELAAIGRRVCENEHDLLLLLP